MLTKNFTSMGDFDVIISIVCPDDDSIKSINENHLVVKMWDIDEPLENKFRKYEPPSYEDCSKVIKFIDSNKNNQDIKTVCNVLEQSEVHIITLIDKSKSKNKDKMKIKTGRKALIDGKNKKMK